MSKAPTAPATAARGVTVERAAPVNDRREIFGWTMYDWAGSAFSTTVGGVLLGPYVTSLAQSAVGDNGTVMFGVSVLTGRSTLYSGFRQMGIGAAAAAITYAVGTIIGVGVAG